MEIYEFGRSVALTRMGHTLQNRTYVCVIDTEEDITIASGVELMVEQLRQKDINIINVQGEVATAENGDTYTIAHEVIYNKGSVLKRLSNLLRHSFSQDFYIDSTYIDENNQLCDLTNHGLNAIERRDLSSPLEYKQMHEKGIDFLVNLLDITIRYRLNFSGTIYDYLETINPDALPPVDKSNPVIKELAEKHGQKLIKYIDSYGRLRDYFYNICGIGYDISFDLERAKVNTEQSKINPERSVLDKFLDKPVTKRGSVKFVSTNPYGSKGVNRPGSKSEFIPFSGNTYANMNEISIVTEEDRISEHARVKNEYDEIMNNIRNNGFYNKNKL